MKRWVATLLLLLVVTFLAASGVDHCHDGPGARNQGAPHMLCSDDCTPILLPALPAAPPADPMPRPGYAETVVRPVLDLDLEPEKAPPRP